MKKMAAALVFLSALAPISMVASNADACMEAVRLEPTQQKPTPAQEIANAEHALDASEDKVLAATTVLHAFPSIRTATAGQNPLETRALRVLALALIRSDGQATLADGWQPETNVAWAVQSLREIDASRPNDPAVQADLGEALAKVASSKDEAFKILGNLAQKDLMGSPHAYATLAKLRSERGDASGSAQAVKRCEDMARNHSICHVVAKA